MLLSFYVDGDGEVLDHSGHQKCGGLQSVVVVDDETRQVLSLGSCGVPGLRVLLCESALSNNAFVQAVLLDKVPAVLILQALNRANPCLPTFPALHHALQRFEHVEAIDIEAAIRDRHRMFLSCAEGRVDCGNALGDRHRGTREHWEPKLTRDVDHALGLTPVPGQMFVVEDRTEPRPL